MFDLDQALNKTVEEGASDLHVKVPAKPHIRVQGELRPLDGYDAVTPQDTVAIREQILQAPLKRKQFEDHGYADLSYFTGNSRFRVAAFSQRGSASFVFRAIPDAPGPEGWGIPDVVLSWANAPRGLVLVTGPTGSGKSTTCAVMVGLVNARRSAHIVTIEDPIEFLHTDKKGLVSQREIGIDASTNTDALRATLRQDPDVILVGEIRDEDTAETAMRAAETGHLVIATMHTSDATETIQRLIDLFPIAQAGLARKMIASTLIGTSSQRLIPGTDGTRKLNAEVLVNSARVRDMIEQGRPSAELTQALAEGEYYGMQTFDQDLLTHVQEGRIAEEDAVAYSTSPHDFRLMLAGTAAPRTSTYAASTQRPL